MKRQGKSLEQLVAHMENALAGNPNIKIDSPAHLPDRTTGRLREHDVVIRLNQGHHHVIIAIECRDRSRSVGVEQVEAFKTKCEDTGINQAIIVSPSGFFKSALKKAQHYGIRCLSIQEAHSFSWLIASNLAVYQLNLINVAWHVILQDLSLADSINQFTITDAQGNIISNEVLNRNVLNKLHAAVPPPPAGNQNARMFFSGIGVFIRDGNTGQLHPLSQLIADANYNVALELSPFQLLKYGESESESSIAEAAIAKIDAGDTPGRLVALRKPDGSMSIGFIPSSKTDDIKPKENGA